MKKTKLLVVAIAGVLALSACSDSDLVSTSLSDETVSTIAEGVDDMAATVAEVQSEVSDLATEVQNSAAATDLEESWDALQTAVLAAVASIGDDGMVDGSQVQDSIDDFQSDLDTLGDQVEPTLSDAWDTLKQRLEGMMS